MIDHLIARIRAERVRQRLTQAQLAAIAGYSRNAIYFLESGRRGTRMETIVDCAQALGLRLALVPAEGADTSGRPDGHELAAIERERVRSASSLSHERSGPTPAEHIAGATPVYPPITEQRAAENRQQLAAALRDADPRTRKSEAA